MALAHNPPNTIHLGGVIEKMNEWIAGATITPGMQIELYDAGSGKMKWRPHSSATNRASNIFALEKLIHNKTVDDNYAENELVIAAKFLPGSSVWACVPSGQDITAGESLQSNGDGWLKTATSEAAAANVAAQKALETLGAVTTLTRVRTQIL